MHLRNTAAALLALAVAAGCDRAPTSSESAPSRPTALPAVAGHVPTRAEERPGALASRGDAELWAYVSAGGGLAVVGLKAPGAARGIWHGRLLMDRSQWEQSRHAVLGQPGVDLVSVDELLPTVQVRIGSQTALAALRKLPMVDYVEPAQVSQPMQQFASSGSSGCGYGGAWTGDRQLTASGDIYSQRYAAMGITSAWNLSSGAGVTVGLTDTGISSSQAEMTSQFAAGQSTGRTLKLLKVASVASPYDECGHGTRMSSVIAAPRNGSSVTGVAWKANLVSVHQANGVAAVSSSDAKESVRTAAQNGSRVIVMAWESLNWFWQVSDEIEYWHYNTQTLFVAAAGTSGCGDGVLDSNVVFPADMDVVLAVTGISYPNGGVPCGIHYGPEVDVTAYLEVPAAGQYTGDVVGIGGSSNATAVVGGVAALIWSRTPTLTRDQVRARLETTAAGYPTRSSSQGYGLINAYRAVSGT